MSKVLEAKRGEAFYHPILGKVHYHEPHPTYANHAYVTHGAYRYEVQTALLSVNPWPAPVWTRSSPDGLYTVELESSLAVRRVSAGQYFMVDKAGKAVGPSLNIHGKNARRIGD